MAEQNHGSDIDQRAQEFEEHAPSHDHFGDDHPPAEEGEGPWLVSYADLMTLLMGFFALIASFSKPDVKAFEEVKKSTSERFGGTYEEPYEKLEQQIRQALEREGLSERVAVKSESDGVTLSVRGAVLFDSGAFVLNPDGAKVIETVVKGLGGGVTKYNVVIEGHTDNVPISHSIIASNWELSAIRAARVAQIFETHGFAKDSLTIQGWGETRAEVPNATKAGVPIPENQARNRRVILKISDQTMKH